MQVLFWLIICPIGFLLFMKMAYKEHRQEGDSAIRATGKTAKDATKTIVTGIVVIAVLLVFLWVINGAQRGVGQL